MFYLMIFIWGLLIGSFLNVCIFRIPRGEDIVFSRSRCRSCGEVLRWYELIPVFSFLIQRGRCRHCGKRLSLRYPLVELLNGLLYLWVAAASGRTLESLIFCVCSSILIVVALIDAETLQIPPGCNIGIGILGVLHLFLDLSHFWEYIIGMCLVSGLFLAAYYLTKGEGIGGGDIKLMAAAGLLLGWQKILVAFFIGSAAGVVIHFALMKLKGKGHVLAFGPYLAAGIFIAMLYGDRLLAWYLNIYAGSAI